jgi:hypothetical protein
MGLLLEASTTPFALLMGDSRGPITSRTHQTLRRVRYVSMLGFSDRPLLHRAVLARGSPRPLGKVPRVGELDPLGVDTPHLRVDTGFGRSHERIYRCPLLLSSQHYPTFADKSKVCTAHNTAIFWQELQHAYDRVAGL